MSTLAIFILNSGIISRSSGGSAIQNAAYISGQELTHEQQKRATIGIDYRRDLNNQLMSDDLRNVFAQRGIELSEEAKIIRLKRRHWVVHDGDTQYSLKEWNTRETDKETGKRTITKKGIDIFADKTHSHVTREDVIATWIQAPENAPDWVYDREKLWNRAESSESKRTAQVAFKLMVALPRELSDEQNKALLQKWVDEQFTSKSAIADIAIHRTVASDGKANIHAHLMYTPRALAFDEKDNEWKFSKVKNPQLDNNWQNFKDKKDNLINLRKSWADIQNEYLAEKGIEVSHETLERQGLERKATIHLGSRLWAAEMNGFETAFGKYNREIEQDNTNQFIIPSHDVSEIFTEQSGPEHSIPKQNRAAVASWLSQTQTSTAFNNQSIDPKLKAETANTFGQAPPPQGTEKEKTKEDYEPEPSHP